MDFLRQFDEKLFHHARDRLEQARRGETEIGVYNVQLRY